MQLLVVVQHTVAHECVGQRVSMDGLAATDMKERTHLLLIAHGRITDDTTDGVV